MMMRMRVGRCLMMTFRSKAKYLLVLFVLLWVGADSLSTKVYAWGACPRFVDAISLVPEIAETASTQIGQDFYTTTLSFRLSEGVQAFLASSSDGQSPVSSDDQFSIQVLPSGRSWVHDFRNPAKTQIVSLPAQDISHLFSIGENTITVKVTDLFVPNYSSRPYFLVLIKECATSTPVPTTPPTSTLTPAPTATSTLVPPSPTVIATSTPIMQMVVVTATPSKTLMPSATLTTTSVLVEISSPPTEVSAFMNHIAQWLLVGFLLSFGGTGLWWLAFRRHSRLGGEFEVYLHEAYVTTYVLSDFSQGIIAIGQRGDITLPELVDEGVVARIVVTEGEGSAHMRPSINVRVSEGTEQRWVSHILTDGYVLSIRPYRLIYRAYQPEVTVLEEETYA